VGRSALVLSGRLWRVNFVGGVVLSMSKDISEDLPQHLERILLWLIIPTPAVTTDAARAR